MAEPTLDIRGFKIDGDNPLSEAQTGAVLAPFTGDKRGLSQIEAAATALERAIRAEGFVFHRVFVPVQKPVDGQISLQILRFTLDQVTMSGNEKFSTENIRASLPSLPVVGPVRGGGGRPGPDAAPERGGRAAVGEHRGDAGTRRGLHRRHPADRGRRRRDRRRLTPVSRPARSS